MLAFVRRTVLHQPYPSNSASSTQIEVESKLQSLQARLDDMTDKYARAVAEQDSVDGALLREERVRCISGMYVSITKCASWR